MPLQKVRSSRLRTLIVQNGNFFVKILEGTALLPIDVEEGMWRIDQVHEWLAHKLLQEDLKEFVHSDVHSEGVLRQLVVEDMDEESRAVLYDFRMS